MAEIKLLKDHPDYAPILAFWSFQNWYRERTIPFDTIVKSYLQRTGDGSLPMAWVALDRGMPVGMASLKENDLWSRKDLNPWLASLYVLPEFRKRGIAGELIRSVVDKTGGLGYGRLHLFVSYSEGVDIERFYTDRGWSYLEDALDNDGKETKIFYIRP